MNGFGEFMSIYPLLIAIFDFLSIGNEAWWELARARVEKNLR